MKARATYWIHQDMQKPAVMNIGAARELASFSSPFPGFGNPNQDAMAAVHGAGGRLVLLLADGAGGMPDGDKASEFVVKSVSNSVRNANGNADSAILQSVFRCQEKMCLGRSGTTLTAAEIHKDKIRAFHCGDSELLLLDAKGRVRYRTTSHSPTGYLQAAGVLSSNDALRHPDRPFISNYLGADGFFLQVSPWLGFDRGDWLIVGSDGLFDNLTIGQIQSRVRKSKCASEVAAGLAQSSLKQMDKAHRRKGHGKADDISLMVLGRR